MLVRIQPEGDRLLVSGLQRPFRRAGQSMLGQMDLPGCRLRPVTPQRTDEWEQRRRVIAPVRRIRVPKIRERTIRCINSVEFPTAGVRCNRQLRIRQYRLHKPFPPTSLILLHAFYVVNYTTPDSIKSICITLKAYCCAFFLLVRQHKREKLYPSFSLFPRF